MKHLLYLLLFIPILLNGQPGSPDANGVITAGPPWVTGVQQGDGELKLQFTYLNAAILLNDAEITVIEDSITDISARSISNSDHTNLSNIGDLIHPDIDSMLRDSTRIFNALSSFSGIPGAIPGDGLSDTAGINSAIRAARDLPTFGDNPTVLIPYGRYNMEGPIKAMTDVNIRIEPGATFTVPSGYTGSCLLFDDNIAHADLTISGGEWIEDAPRSYDWSGIKIDKQTSNSYFMSYCTISNMRFYYCGKVIEGITDNGGWANENVFFRVNGYNFIRGLAVTDGGENSQFRNEFIACSFQAGTETLIGIDNLPDGPCSFVLCNFWDFNISDSTDVKIVTVEDQSEHTFDGCNMIPRLSGPPNSEFENVSYEKKIALGTISFSQDGIADSIVYVPDLGIVWDINMRITTNFDDSGTDLLDIGYIGDNAAFLNDEDVSSGAGSFTSITPSLVPLLMFNNNWITVTYNGQNSDATVGSVTVWVTYSIF